MPRGLVMAIEPATRIAIFDGDDGVMELYREIFEDEPSFRVSFADVRHDRGETARLALGEHDPAAVIWDISPPYDEACDELTRLSEAGQFDGRALIVTTTDTRTVTARLGTRAIIIAKPFDVDALMALIHRSIAPERREDPSSRPAEV